MNKTAIGRYKVLTEIGRGAMGIVYKALDPTIDRTVAVKTISLFDLEPDDDREYRQRFYQEARTAGRLSHPGIVTIFDVGEDPETNAPYIVMEYVAGRSLSKVLAADDGRLQVGPAVQLVQEVAEALHYAHNAGVVHRDVKPANILITAEGHAKLADFGIARLNQTQLTLPGQVLGSPAYMAPEQLNGEDIDGRSDLFSLGVVLYTMVTGHRPFQGTTTATVCFKLLNRAPLPASTLNPDLPAQMDRLLERAMAKDPTHRFQTGQDMARQLRDMARELQEPREGHRSQEDTFAGLREIIQRPSISSHAPTQSSTHSRLENLQPAQAAPIAPTRSRNQSLAKTAGLIAVIAFAIGFVSWSIISHRSGKQTAGSIAKRELESKAGEPVPEKVAQVPSVNAETASVDENRSPPTMGKVKGTSPTRSPEPQPVKRKAVPDSQVTASGRTASGLNADMSAPQQTITLHELALANLEVVIEHGFQEAELSISVDNRLVYNQELRGENKRRAVLFRHTQGRQSGSMTLLPGKHDFLVRVWSAANDYDESTSFSRGFTPGSKRTLLVKCDNRRNKLVLALE